MSNKLIITAQCKQIIHQLKEQTKNFDSETVKHLKNNDSHSQFQFNHYNKSQSTFSF